MTNRDRVNKLRQCECQRCKQQIGNRGFVAVPGGAGPQGLSEEGVVSEQLIGIAIGVAAVIAWLASAAWDGNR